MALCQICVYANSASNPLIYSAVNEQFREGFKNYFRSWIDCVLKIKGSRRKDNMRTNKRRTKAKPVGGCSFCGQSDTSLNGTLCNSTNNSSQCRHLERREFLIPLNGPSCILLHLHPYLRKILTSHF